MRELRPFIEPFSHTVIDDFFPHDVALQLEADFPPYHDPAWYVYNNALERKKTLNHWHMFPPATYRAFQELCGMAPHGTEADYGLHGGGWHIHTSGGELNPHLDYELHPLLGMHRKWNLIVYLSSDYKEEYGGHLGFWRGDIGEPVKAIYPKFNRAVLFETSGSVHGLASRVLCPEGVYRKSIAVYYVEKGGVGTRSKAKFFPRPGQEGNAEVVALIERRERGEYR